MATNEVRVNLTAKGFPFKFDELSSTVFVNRGLEQQRQYIPGFDGDESAQSFGLCQAFYMENVLPQIRGYSSVHWGKRLEAVAPELLLEDVGQVFVLRDSANNVALYAPANGQNFVYDADVGEWRAYPFSGTLTANVTVTHLKGTSYICYAGLGIFVYDFYTSSMVAQTPLGISMSGVRGVCAANQYLLIWDANTLYWSSATEPMDFLPGLSTGAGSSSVLAVRSEITQVLPISDGYICYTTTNAVGATYSGDPVTPWIFREIPGSAGVALAEHVSYEANLAVHFAWTTSGFQQMTLRQAEPLWPELTDAIARGLYSDIVSPDTVPSVVKAARLAVRVATIGARYVCVSLKDSQSTGMYQFAYVYDLGMDRWGKIKVPHTDVFEFRPPEFAPITTYDQLIVDGLSYDDLLLTAYDELGAQLESSTVQFGDSFGIIQNTGKVFTATFADASLNDAVDYQADHTEAGAAEPCIIHGRYKLARPAGVELQQIQLTRAADETLTAIVHDTAGDIVSSVAVTSDQYAPVNNDYLCRVYGDSVSLKLAGKFTLTDLLMRFRNGGTRNSPRRPLMT